MRTALVRRPGPRLADGLVTHIERVAIDDQLADREPRVAEARSSPLVDDAAIFPHLLAVPEESGAHVVCLSEDHLLMAADCPDTVGMLEDRGYWVSTVDISEFQKLEGCVTCLSVRIRVPVG